METSNMKNMVVLKNLPSNLVEEAIIILKSSKKVKKLEKIERIEKKNKKEKNQNIKKEKDYILKEAEMLVSNYLSKIESTQENKPNKKMKNNKKYHRLKNYAYLSTMIIIIQALLLITK
ncbi:MAG: hypothetical protein HFJ33_06105 [Clostridia bacterium]|nr:hypothetical protein [Clostridia bacterium]